MVLNSKDAVDSVKFMADFWKEALDEGGLARDDTNNNRAFLSGTICATLNGASIGRKPVDSAFQSEDHRHVRATKLRPGVHNALQNRLQFELGSADRAKNLRRRPLP